MSTDAHTGISNPLSAETASTVTPFRATLERHGLELTRGQTAILQVNVGLRCNQVCKHCHLEAGPDRTESISRETARQVADLAYRGSFQVIDVTGGAPELHPGLPEMVRLFASVVPKVMVRCNLTAIATTRQEALMELFKAHRVVIVASLPSLDPRQCDAQRGKGVWHQSLETLRKLNSLGYGCPGSGLELHLVSNPSGAYLPPAQAQVEKKFRVDMQRKWGLVFNNLFTFANMPLGRFRSWLVQTDNHDPYLQDLSSRFNPCTVEGLMCRTLISVSWDGYVYDCDFNLAAGIHSGCKKTHITELDGPPAVGSAIAVSDHCYACTAGSGFT